MENPPTYDELAKLPGLFSNPETSPLDSIVYMRFYFHRDEWFMTEYDHRLRTFFGFSIIRRGEHSLGSWGFFGLDPMLDYHTPKPRCEQIERDVDWKPTRARDVPAIRSALQKKISRDD